VILFALSILSPEYFPEIFNSENKTALLLTGITTGLMVGFFEELGWTGFLAATLQGTHDMGIRPDRKYACGHTHACKSRNSYAEYCSTYTFRGQPFNLASGMGRCFMDGCRDHCPG
jgi:hypothetical protein